MRARDFEGLLMLLTVAVLASHALAPGLAVLVLIAGAFALAVADHRISARREAEAEARRERLREAARR